MTDRIPIRVRQEPENGRRTVEYALADGGTESETYFPGDGPLLCRGFYRNGELHGSLTYYHPSGKLHWTAEFVDGRRVDGVYETFDENGRVSSVERYVGGLPQGEGRWFDAFGRLKYVMWSLDGELCSRKRYAAACAKRPELPRDGLTDEVIAKAANARSRKKPKLVYPKLKLASKTDPRVSGPPELSVSEWKARGAVDAQEWLAQPGRSMPRSFDEKSPRSSREMCEYLLELGAPALLVVPAKGQDLDVDDTAIRLLILLPDDSRKRSLLFGFENEYAQERGVDGQADFGQSYLLMTLK